MITCPFCASAISDDHAAFCPHCGRQFTGTPVSAAPQQVETSGKAIASLALGIPFFFFLSAIVAVVLGHLAKRDIRRSGGRLKGNGLATAGLVLGYTGIAVIPIILIIMAIAIPSLVRTRMLADETSAIGSLRTIATTATAYSATYSNGFPPSLAALGPPPSGGENDTCDHSDLIDGILASGRKNGYVFTYKGSNPLPAAAQGCSSPGFNSFTINADPVTRGQTGQRSFFVGPSGTIRYNGTRPAKADDAPIGN